MSKEYSLNIERTKIQMRKGTLELSVLLIISEGKAYASTIIEELKKADLIVVEGTLYPLLSRLKRSNLLDYEWEESNSGPPRKYYTLTPEGKDTLISLNKAWIGLQKSINALRKKYEKSN
jgi:PadR family transcriptional regulator PadR